MNKSRRLTCINDLFLDPDHNVLDIAQLYLPEKSPFKLKLIKSEGILEEFNQTSMLTTKKFRLIQCPQHKFKQKQLNVVLKEFKAPLAPVTENTVKLPNIANTFITRLRKPSLSYPKLKLKLDIKRQLMKPLTPIKTSDIIKKFQSIKISQSEAILPKTI